jgi:hypothetical protein
MTNSQRKQSQRRWAWLRLIRAKSGAKVRNRFHEGIRPCLSQEDDISSPTTWTGQNQLEVELNGWESASDEDFEKFETSLG